MRIDVVVLAAALALAPVGARAADLVVWWDKAFYAEPRGGAGSSASRWRAMRDR
jgi:hypothetical protein